MKNLCCSSPQTPLFFFFTRARSDPAMCRSAAAPIVVSLLIGLIDSSRSLLLSIKSCDMGGGGRVLLSCQWTQQRGLGPSICTGAPGKAAFCGGTCQRGGDWSTGGEPQKKRIRGCSVQKLCTKLVSIGMFCYFVKLKKKWGFNTSLTLLTCSVEVFFFFKCKIVRADNF